MTLIEQPTQQPLSETPPNNPDILPSLYRVMAIDFGTKRLGIAVSDEMRMLASPRGVIMNGPEMIREIVELIRNQNVRIVLLGIPRTLRNTESDMTAQVLKFGEKLEATLARAPELGVTLVRRDERLTSIMANQNIAERGLPKAKREVKSLRDEEAARIVLQEYLDEKR